MNGNRFSVGLTDATPIDNPRLLASSRVPFVSGDMSKRIDPKRILPEAESIIVVCVPYEMKNAYSSLSSLGVCEDYHKNVRCILQALANELAKTHGTFEYKILVDSPALCERSLAVRAGLGYFGKNGLLILPEFGSRFNIGIMLADVPFNAACSSLWLRQETTPNACALREVRSSEGFASGLRQETNPFANALRAKRGGVGFLPLGLTELAIADYDVLACPQECDLCIRACPNGAISEGKPLDVGKCISYLSQKDILSTEEEKLLHGQLYGCDICQNVCPKNTALETSYVSPSSILNQSDTQINEKFGHTAMNWKINLLKRNALISAKITGYGCA